MSEPARTAWALPIERMPVSRLSAPRLRSTRLGEWLSGMGYDTRAVLPSGNGSRGRGTGAAMLDAALWLAAAPWLAARARREGPALVLAASVLHAPALALIRRSGRERPLVVVDAMGLRSMEVDRTARLASARALYRPAWRVLERLAFASADVVLTVNDATAETIRRRYGHPRVRTIRDAAESELTRVRPADRASIGVPEASVVVCFMGSVVCRRLDRLFAAWRLLAQDERLRLVVVGDGPDLDHYRHLASELPGVQLLGALPRERALRAVRACDIAYTGSWSRAGFSFKLYEYLALGMPILVEAKPQMRETLRDGENAAFYSTTEDLVRQVRRLAEDPGLRAHLGDGARRTFRAGHSLEARRREFENAMGALDG